MMKKLLILSGFCFIVLSCKAQYVESLKSNLPAASVITTTTPGATLTGIAPGANGTIFSIVGGKPGFYTLSQILTAGNIALPAGPKGDQGIQGPAGATGPAGKDGAAAAFTPPANATPYSVLMFGSDMSLTTARVGLWFDSDGVIQQTTAQTLVTQTIPVGTVWVSGTLTLNNISAGGSVSIVVNYTDVTNNAQTKTLATATTVFVPMGAMIPVNIKPGTSVSVSTTFASGTTANYNASHSIHQN